MGQKGERVHDSGCQTQLLQRTRKAGLRLTAANNHRELQGTMEEAHKSKLWWYTSKGVQLKSFKDEVYGEIVSEGTTDRS